MEHGTSTSDPSIVPFSCPVPADGAPKLSGAGAIRLKPGSRAYRIFKREQITEEYFCNYEVNPDYEAKLEAAGLHITGRGPGGEARIEELAHDRFFVATLFQPQLTSAATGRPHPFILEYLASCGSGRMTGSS